MCSLCDLDDHAGIERFIEEHGIPHIEMLLPASD